MLKKPGAIVNKAAILSIAVVVAGSNLAWAEETKNPMNPLQVGDITGDEEKDTIGYDMNSLADIYVLSHPCGIKSCDNIVTNPAGKPVYIGRKSGEEEKDTFAYPAAEPVMGDQSSMKTDD
jgi:hypothetical protein